MTLDKLKQLINETCSHVLFCYNGQNCGIDPFLPYFAIWYGEKDKKCDTLDEALNIKLFEGKSLIDIIDNTYDWEPNE